MSPRDTAEIRRPSNATSKNQESGFVFWRNPNGWTVYLGNRTLGTIVSTKERGGRASFTLGCEDADGLARIGGWNGGSGLKVLDSLKQHAKKARWNVESLIIKLGIVSLTLPADGQGASRMAVPVPSG